MNSCSGLQVLRGLLDACQNSCGRKSLSLNKPLPKTWRPTPTTIEIRAAPTNLLPPWGHSILTILRIAAAFLTFRLKLRPPPSSRAASRLRCALSTVPP